MLKPLLIEIGTEELPAIPFLKELPNVEKKWSDILEKISYFVILIFFILQEDWFYGIESLKSNKMIVKLKI